MGALLPSALLVLAGCSPAPGPPTVVLPTTAAVVVSTPPSDPTAIPSRAPAKAEPRLISWLSSDREARERARRMKIPLLVWVRADWDASSMAMERKVWTDPHVVSAARAFVPLRLDVTETEGDAERLAEQYEVKGVPTTVLFDATGRRVLSIVGFHDAEPLAAALRRAAEE